MSDQQPLSDLEVLEQSVAHMRDALAGLQQIPAAGLDDVEHETVSRMVDDVRCLERSLSNEVDQMRGNSDKLTEHVNGEHAGEYKKPDWPDTAAGRLEQSSEEVEYDEKDWEGDDE